MYSSSKKATLKINPKIGKENVREKSDCSFAYFFLNQYGFDSKKKKMEQYNHAEKLKNQFWAWLVDIYDCQKQYCARSSLSIKISCCFKSPKISIHAFRNSLDTHKDVLKFVFVRFTIKIGSCWIEKRNHSFWAQKSNPSDKKIVCQHQVDFHFESVLAMYETQKMIFVENLFLEPRKNLTWVQNR